MEPWMKVLEPLKNARLRISTKNLQDNRLRTTFGMAISFGCLDYARDVLAGLISRSELEQWIKRHSG